MTLSAGIVTRRGEAVVPHHGSSNEVMKVMNRKIAPITLATSVAVLVSLVVTAGAAAPAGAAPAGSPWSVMASPNPSSYANQLYAVAAVSATDVWAVGDYVDTASGTRETLVEQWNGTSWSVVPSPSPGTFANVLSAVAIVSANDIWAVGYAYSASYSTLTEHWNGTSWSVVASPSPSASYSLLFGLAAVSATEVWTVGYYQDATGVYRTLIEQWNGTSWSVVPSPNPGSTNDALYGVTAVSAHDVWAVGSYTSSAVGGTLVEQWNGTSWSVVPSPSPDADQDQLLGVAAVSSSDVWAVGHAYSMGNYPTLVEQWNGSPWRVVSSPSPSPSTIAYLDSVAAVSASDVWGVGYACNCPSGLHQTLTEQSNGKKWSVVASPNPATADNFLNGVVALATGQVWAVGYSQYTTASGGYTYQTLILSNLTG
jgi:hypothetical protein